MFEQGAGVLDVAGAFVLLSRYTPRASLLPPQLDLTDPYMWPFSRQVREETAAIAAAAAEIVVVCYFAGHCRCDCLLHLCWSCFRGELFFVFRGFA